MYTEEIELQIAEINESKQIEVRYFIVGKNNDIEVSRRSEGMVWQPSSNPPVDTLSWTLLEVKLLVEMFWTPEVIAAYQAAQTKRTTA